MKSGSTFWYFGSSVFTNIYRKRDDTFGTQLARRCISARIELPLATIFSNVCPQTFSSDMKSAIYDLFSDYADQRITSRVLWLGLCIICGGFNGTLTGIATGAVTIGLPLSLESAR